jgi:hypothetical protein
MVALEQIESMALPERLQIAHLFLCRKCSHNMEPLHSLQ